MSYLFKRFAISIFVPTPSVLATNWGFLKFFGMFVIDPNPPIFSNFLLFVLFFDNEDINFTNLSASLMLTPLFSYVKLAVSYTHLRAHETLRYGVLGGGG